MASEESQGVKDYIKERLLAATDEESLREIRKQLRDEGKKPGSVDACVFELRKQGHLRFGNSHPASTAVVKAQPVERLIQETRLPDIIDGNAPVFDAGVQYGMSCILIGVRVAQELSKMGIEQAGPLIKMAQELRAGSDETAKNVGRALAEVVAESNERVVQAVSNLSIATKAASPDPVQRAVATFQSIPQMFQAMNSLMAMFGMKPVIPQVQPQPGQSQQQQQTQAASVPGPHEPAGITEMSAEEEMRIFG